MAILQCERGTEKFKVEMFDPVRQKRLITKLIEIGFKVVNINE